LRTLPVILLTHRLFPNPQLISLWTIVNDKGQKAESKDKGKNKDKRQSQKPKKEPKNSKTP
jgi:hypothetical protein